MSSPGPDDSSAPSLPTPELAGLDPKELLQAGLETVPPVTLPPQPVDSDATIAVARPQPTQPAAQVELPLPEELTKLLPGGNYHVESFLGQGGMGAVYKGVQVRLKRPVAIKIMRRDMGKDYDFEARFEREAQAMAKLNHPNIVSVIDFGEAGPDYLYIVMELIDGADLMDVIRGGQMTQEMALSLLPQVCDALQFAHDHGIVHRDIKPSNIMLTRDGRVKMCDFGLAKRYDVESSFRTQTGTGMGTPDYAAPEQFDPKANIDHRADIYALGVMIYQMITGQLPRGVWKPPSQRAEVAPQWDDIVSRAMQSDPSDRYQQAVEVKTDVTSIPLRKEGSANERSAGTPARLNQSGGAAAKNHEAVRSDRAPVKSRTPLIFGLLVGTVVIAAGAFFALRSDRDSIQMDSAPAAAVATPKQTLDLIALVDVQRDRMKAEGNAGANVWTKSGGQLVFTSGDKRAGKISAPVALNGLRDYEIEVGVTNPGADPIGIDLPMSATNQATIAYVPGEVVVVRDGNTSKVFGNWPKDAASPPWKLATRVKFDSDGINGTIAATINGTAVGEWRGALGKLNKPTEPHPDFPGQLVPALYIRSGDRTHSSWTLRVFEGEAKVLRSAAATPAPIAAPALPESGWKPLINASEWRTDWSGETEYRGTKQKASREFRDGLLHLRNTGIHTPQPSPDGAIRASIVIREGSTNIGVVMRNSSTLGRYKLGIGGGSANDSIVLTYNAKSGDSLILARHDLAKPLQTGDKVRIELRVQGHHLTGLFNGAVVAEANDSRLTESGEWSLDATDGWIESVEVQPLPAAATPAPIAAPALPESGWKPLFTEKEWKAESRSADDQWREFKDGLLHMHAQHFKRPQDSPDGAVRAAIMIRAGSETVAVTARHSDSKGYYKLGTINDAKSILLTYFGTDKSATYALLGKYEMPRPLRPGDKLLLELRVQGNRLTGLVNGTAVIDAQDDRLTAAGEWGIHAKDGWYESVEVQPLPAAAPALPESGWKPLFTEAEWKSTNAAAGRESLNGVLHLTNNSWRRPQPSPDGAVRARVKAHSAGRATAIILRHVEGRGEYSLGLNGGSRTVELYYSKGGKLGPETLGRYAVPAATPPDGFVALELRAEGSRLTALLNGAVLGTVIDNRITEAGEWGLGASDGWYESVEVQPLPAAATPAPIAAPALPESGWKSLFTKQEWEKHIARDDVFRGKMARSTREFADGLLHVRATGMTAIRPSADGAIRARMVIREGSNLAVVVARSTQGDGSYRLKTLPGLKQIELTFEAPTGKANASLGIYDLPKPLQMGDQVLLELRTQGDRLTGLLNGKAAIEAQDKRIQAPGEWGIVVEDAWFESVEVQPLPAAVATIKLWDTPEKLPKQKGVSWENGAVVLESSVLGYDVQKSRDAILRVSVLMTADNAGGMSFYVRYKDSAGKYSVAPTVVDPNAGPSVELRLNLPGGGYRALAKWPLPRAYRPDEWARFELHAIGNRLTVMVDDRTLGTVQDGTLMEPGSIGVHSIRVTRIRDIEYVPLDAPAVSPSPTAPASASSVLTFGGHHYQLISTPSTWAEAKAKAEAMGGHLATFTTEAEERWARDTILQPLSAQESASTKAPDQLYWIGGHVAAQSKDIRWLSGEPVGKIGWRNGNPGWRELADRPETKTVGTRFAAGLVVERPKSNGEWISVQPQSYQRAGFIVEWDDAGGAAAVSPAPNLPVSKSSDQKFPPGQWVKLFTKPEDLPADLRKPDSGVTWEDGWINFSQKRSLPLGFASMQNYGIRARFSRGTNSIDSGRIVLRFADGSRAYLLRMSGPELTCQKLEQGKYPKLFTAQVAVHVPPCDSYSLEFAAVGSRLIGRYGDQTMQTASDTSSTNGTAFIDGSEPVRDIEVLNLDGLPEAEALRLLGVDEKGNDLRGKTGK